MTKFSSRALQSGPTAALAIPALLAGAVALYAAFYTALASPAAAAEGYDVGSIHISQPWSRATPKGAASGAGYMTLTNNGTTPDRVSCVSDDVSAQCQIHSVTMEGGVMKMRPVEGGLEIKPGESVMLKPGGNHIMFSLAQTSARARWDGQGDVEIRARRHDRRRVSGARHRCAGARRFSRWLDDAGIRRRHAHARRQHAGRQHDANG
jgi:copper(I)-binding protein